ncbi:MAG: hypothetical protein DRR08_10185 [Candidatus Parabeggiatoa sp. nov. 2]|nr:MAG: hypothetical protein B6247_25375 [Beggiatoa sp. 4572_84]RKZ60884.1 MAG: hypothetical protein DRR08_10185 [Gammaproteobacteria bacterium]
MIAFQRNPLKLNLRCFENLEGFKPKLFIWNYIDFHKNSVFIPEFKKTCVVTILNKGTNNFLGSSFFQKNFRLKNV